MLFKFYVKTHASKTLEESAEEAYQITLSYTTSFFEGMKSEDAAYIKQFLKNLLTHICNYHLQRNTSGLGGDYKEYFATYRYPEFDLEVLIQLSSA